MRLHAAAWRLLMSVLMGLTVCHMLKVRHLPVSQSMSSVTVVVLVPNVGSITVQLLA